MASRTHTSPDGQTRFQVLAELSHTNIGIFERDYAGITIFRDVKRAVTFNAFDPSTWFGGSTFVRSGTPGTIIVSGAFEDASGNDISGVIQVHETNETGHFGRFSLFAFWGAPLPTDLHNDARSVTKVRVTYHLPWEQGNHNLSQP